MHIAVELVRDAGSALFWCCLLGLGLVLCAFALDVKREIDQD